MVTFGNGGRMGGHHQATMTEPRPGVPVPSESLLDAWSSRRSTSSQDCVDAAAWGADEQLRMCVEWLDGHLPGLALLMQEIMRPSPISLKRQAIDALVASDKGFDDPDAEWPPARDIIRRALEFLPD